ncbi:MAG: lysostaphin resistance A-like protein [Phycisphaerales bacterium]
MTMDHRPRRTRRGNPIVPADPGTRSSRALTLLLTIIFAALAIGWQNMPEDVQRAAVLGPEPVPTIPTSDTRAPGSMFTEMYLRMYLKMNNATAIRTELAKDPDGLEQLINQVDAFAEGPADRIRTVILEAEMVGPEQALDRIETLRFDLMGDREALQIDSSDDAVARYAAAQAVGYEFAIQELNSLQTVYTDGPDELDQSARDQLAARYGVFGELTLSWGQSENTRAAMLGQPWLFLGIALGFTVLVIGSVLIGFGILVWGLTWIGNARTRFYHPIPEPGGSVMLETYAWFVGAFFVYVVAATAIQFHLPEYALYTLPAQWTLMLVPLWPLLRGMRSREWRHAMGLTRGQGVFREIGAGFVAYLASLPLFLVGVGITLIVIVVQMLMQASQAGAPPAVPPSNPIVDLIGSGDPTIIIFIVTLATIWAPITEELIFRGALFRHLRSRIAWPIAAIISAVLFAYLHSYGPLMVAPLIALGFMFAFMREWRGSIIAPMTAHFLHNGTLMCLMISMAYALS